MPAVDDEFERRRDRVSRVGQLVFGERFQSPLAELLGVSQSTIAQVVGDKIDLSADLEDRLGVVAIEQAEELMRRAALLARLAIEIADDRRRGLGRLRQSPQEHERDANQVSERASSKVKGRTKKVPASNGAARRSKANSS
jgi:plasmid maintenance system antidote protein VapI